MVVTRRTSRGVLAVLLAVALVGASASAGSAGEAAPDGFAPGEADPVSTLVPTRSGLDVYVDDEVIEWAQDRLGVEDVSVSAAAEERAEYLTRELGPSERALLSRSSRIGVTMDVENQKIVEVVDRDAGIAPFALTLTTGCTDNATNRSCVFVNAPGLNVTFTGGSGHAWTSLGGYAFKSWRWFSPRNMKGAITLVTPLFGNYTHSLPPDSFMNFTTAQSFRGMKHG